MRERAEALGGYLTVQPRRSGGTELEVVLPR
jgi:signal transduction histidine kinase